jgi:hypothetical protein
MKYQMEIMAWLNFKKKTFVSLLVTLNLISEHFPVSSILKARFGHIMLLFEHDLHPNEPSK